MNKTRVTSLLKWVALAIGLQPVLGLALTFSLPMEGDMVGRIQTTQAEPGDDFVSIGERFDVGYYELMEANPEVNPHAPKIWGNITVPTRFILPPAQRSGIVVNLAELRLYYFHDGKVLTFPVGVGREGWGTPVCLTKIVAKTKLPTWNVPESIRTARAQEGVHLPKSVPPGPENPLGDYAMRLSVSGGTYLMHGTNDVTGVGRRSSSGCIRMFPEDIEELFALVSVGTPVNIINEAFKVGWDGTRLYLESHVPLDRDVAGGSIGPMVEAVKAAAQKHHVGVDWARVAQVAENQEGMPMVVSVNAGGDAHLAAMEDLKHLKAIEGSHAEDEKAARVALADASNADEEGDEVASGELPQAENDSTSSGDPAMGNE